MITGPVPTLDRCQRLKELGMPQETVLSWHFHRDNESYHGDYWHVGLRGNCSGEEFAAPLATEMLKWLPADILVNGRGTLFIMKHDGSYTVGYGTVKAHEEAELVNALADLLIWCVEQGMDFITTGDLKDLLLAAKALLSSAAATTATIEELTAERDRLITTLHKCQDELASMIGAHGTDTLVTEALRDVTEGLVKCRQERDEARDAAMFLLEFIPDGWPMPKGWEQAVRQARIQAKIYEPAPPQHVITDEDDGYPD
jgi:hypothetical protein